MKQHNAQKRAKNDHLIAIFMKIKISAQFKKHGHHKTTSHIQSGGTLTFSGCRIYDLQGHNNVPEENVHLILH